MFVTLFIFAFFSLSENSPFLIYAFISLTKNLEKKTFKFYFTIFVGIELFLTYLNF